jgi:hypothetical protein
MKKIILRLIGLLTLSATTVCLSNLTFGQQVADPNFQPKVAYPTFTKKRPRVLFDEAHHNFHTAGGRYKPFAELVTADGYQVSSNKEKFSRSLLQGYDILVIANAFGEERGLSAFTDAECDAVRDWVQAGGSLLLIADHNPAGAAAKTLSIRFGVDMSTGHTGDRTNYDKTVPGELGQLVFSRENDLLPEHAITKGRGAAERVNRIITFTGQSLSVPKGGTAFLKLSDHAFDVQLPDEKEVSAANRAQGVALKFKKGRVIILGEAAMLTAQLSARGQKPMGMNYPNNDNEQLALNIMHWLSRKL